MVEWRHLLGTTPLEITATACAIAGVFLIARQRILGWPLGLAWAGLSAYLAFAEWSLVSDGILYLAYLPIQLYCWRVWALRGRSAADAPFLPAWLPRPRQFALAAGAGLCVAAWALGISWLAGRFAWIPEPALLWRDSATTVLNFFAQFLQARKRMENWVGWLIVNGLGIHIYWVRGSPVYALQYAVFLALGLYGWRRWHRSRAAAARPGEERGLPPGRDSVILRAGGPARAPGEG